MELSELMTSFGTAISPPSLHHLLCDFHVAVDASGDVVVAGSTDSFEVFLWSVQTGKLLDVMAGHKGPVSAFAFSPPGANQLAKVAASTLAGQVTFFDIQESQRTNVIDGRKDMDMSGGRKLDGRVSAVNNASGKSYNSLAYTADGACLLTGGNSRYAVLYDVRKGEPWRRRHDAHGQQRLWKVYSLDETVTFDPFDLTIDLIPQSVLEVLAEREYLKALVMTFRLNEKPLIKRVYESIPRGDIRLIARQLPVMYVPLLL
ncbi:quinon protein alcohol dehydrogenase-like superfamily [Flammula alnicola]|nr:quinon protein alcohol dehydrogenase-like superfamily [Flammula alnicola]